MNVPLVVLHSYPVWLPQTQTWMFNQLALLPGDRIEGHVVCERTENLEQFGWPRIHVLEREPRARILFDKGLRKLRLRPHLGFLVTVGRRTRARVLHSHFGSVGWANLGAARRLGIPHVVTFYGLDVNMLPQQELWRRRYQRLFAEADLFLCEGPHMGRCLVRLGCPEHKVRVHHLGVRVGEIPFLPRQWAPGQPLDVLIAATFREKKGIPYALEALGRLQHELPVRITLIGEATPEPRSLAERTRILDIIERHGLRERVRMLGFQPQSVLWNEAARHQLFLSPSVEAADGDTEGGAPVSIIEMAANGMPIVSTTHCDIPEVMRPEAARFLAPERDAAALADIARNMIADWGRLTEPLANLRRHVEREYDAEVQADALARTYEELARA